MDDLRIITYNLLSSEYSTSKSFPKTYHGYLNSDNRYIKIVSKLQKYFSDNTIFCLQELSLEWYEKLSLFLKKNNYDIYYINYGSESSGFMGVGIAIPRFIHVVYFKQQRVSSLKEWPKHHISTINKILSAFSLYDTNKYSSWNNCKLKNNFIIGMVIRYHDQNIVIGNYHMPCSYLDPDIMILHSCLATEFLYRLSNDHHTNKIIFAGDFNSVPGTHSHKFITTGVCDISIYNNLFPPEDLWRPLSKLTLKSSYKEYNGCEPDYTNNAISDYKEFKGCIDYIFYSGVKVTHSSVLIEDTPPFPSENEPSDHIMLLSSFNVSNY